MLFSQANNFSYTVLRNLDCTCTKVCHIASWKTIILSIPKDKLHSCISFLSYCSFQKAVMISCPSSCLFSLSPSNLHPQMLKPKLFLAEFSTWSYCFSHSSTSIFHGIMVTLKDTASFLVASHNFLTTVCYSQHKGNCILKS